ncbi:TonB-dependent receptor plug domain-containing protein, partial [Phenylobacterium sp.]|uniref:TonB-dependent receptor plug domain-containing protein n=1 Tax=Phenylobacterium sp. TaxID=1871053 RepID=UPI0025CFFE68
MNFKLSLLAGVALMGFAGVANAQTDTTVQGVVVTGRYTVDEEIDTATGLGLSVRETPQSVTVITQQRIRDQNLTTIADVVRNTAGVSVVEVDDVRNVFNARGFEIKNYQIDSVPLSWSLAGDSGETIVDMSIYERVEIVRGATGLLTGAGDPSASINLVRK